VADELRDYFSSAANAIGSAEVTNLVSIESNRKTCKGRRFGFNEISSGKVENKPAEND